MSTLGTPERPLRVAIVGSGPSGFYAADPLLKADTSCVVDMYDRLPTPFGLVRGGVAPDHPKIRNVVKVYDKIAARPGFRFLGNVTVGRDIAVNDLRRHYDAIIFACGAETDRRMNIPGEDLAGSYTATSFVGWYNGHPDYRDLTFDLSHETAVVIGVGNVAMDVARILAKTVDELRETDIAQHALDALAESKVRQIYVVGRRGPTQAKFTPPELKEMGQLADCNPVVDVGTLALNEASQEESAEPSVKRNLALLEEYAGHAPDPAKRREMHFVFLMGPTEIRGDGHVASIVLERNRLEGEPFKQRPVATGETVEIPCGLVFRSIGYRGVPLPSVPFHERWGVIPNELGRVVDDGRPVTGLYVVGWIKRGPSGVIGTNKPDSIETAQALLEDVPNLPGCEVPDSAAVDALLADREVNVVTYDDWQRIDSAETEAGAAVGKPRERFTRIAEMLDIVRGPRS